MVDYSKEKHWCLACGKETYVNSSGFCEVCWETFAHLRSEKIRNNNKKEDEK